MNFSNLLKPVAKQDPTDVGDGCYMDNDGTLKNSGELYPMVDTELTMTQRDILVASERASGMSEEDIAYFYPVN